MALNIKAILQRMIEVEASDLHLKVGISPNLRIHGKLEPVTDVDPPSPKDMQQTVEHILTPAQREVFEATREVDFAFGAEGENGRVLVPAVAVGEDREGRFVFVVEASAAGRGVVRRRAVSVGELTADGIEVTAGVSEGERIVTAGVRRLSDGEEVKTES